MRWDCRAGADSGFLQQYSPMVAGVGIVVADDKTIVTNRERAELLENWKGANAEELNALLKKRDSAGFDKALLGYMRARKSPRFFFTSDDISGRIAWIKANLPQETSLILSHADAIMSHCFPRDTSPAAPYDLHLPNGCNWLRSATFDPEAVHALNRHSFWVDLAMAYRFNGNDAYLEELKTQLVSWCTEQGRPPFDAVENGTYWRGQVQWGLLDAAIRGDTWGWTYFLVKDASAWTPEANTLMIHRFLLHNMFLSKQTLFKDSEGKGGCNWFVMQAQGMLNIALLFPEFKESHAWRDQALKCLDSCMRKQFQFDGVHCEQSPSYHVGCIGWFLEPLWLAKLNGCESAGISYRKLKKPAAALFQLLHPDGTIPLLSDSDMIRCDGVLQSAAIALSEREWMRLDETSAHNIMIYGSDSISNAQSYVRPVAVALETAGYYIMRSGDGKRDIQLTFDCGPKGGGHGHSDLLSFELYGFERELLCDPGRWLYVSDADRKWVIGTPAHNTISADGLDHAPLENAEDGFHIDNWEVADNRILVSGHHTGYRSLPGSPVVGRTIWYDRKNTFVILDWGEGKTEHDFTVSFTFPGNDASSIIDGCIRSQQFDGNVLVQNLAMPRQTLARDERFWSPVYGRKEPSIRYTVSQKGSQAVFGHIVIVSDGKDLPNVTAEWGAWPEFGKTVKIRLTVEGISQAIELMPNWSNAERVSEGGQ